MKRNQSICFLGLLFRQLGEFLAVAFSLAKRVAVLGFHGFERMLVSVDGSEFTVLLRALSQPRGFFPVVRRDSAMFGWFLSGFQKRDQFLLRGNLLALRNRVRGGQRQRSEGGDEYKRGNEVLLGSS